MIKQQKQLPTDQKNTQSQYKNCSKIPLTHHSNSFKERINQLKAKIKPCIQVPMMNVQNCDLSISYINEKSKFIPHKQDNIHMSLEKADKYLNNSVSYQMIKDKSICHQSTQKNHNKGKISFSRKGSISESESENELGRMFSQRKVIQMRVSYRQQPYIILRKNTNRNDKKQIKSPSCIQQTAKDNIFKLKLNIKKLEIPQKQLSRQDHKFISYLDKQNRGNNCYEIQDILINNYKTQNLNTKLKAQTERQVVISKKLIKQTQRRNPIKAKKEKIIKGVTKIDVRQCSTKSSTNLQQILKKNSQKGRRNFQHIKTQTSYKAK